MSAKAVVETYLRAWHATDDATRRKLLEASWAADGVYSDVGGTVEGRDAMVREIGAFREAKPGVRIELRSDVDAFARFFRFNWASVDPAGTVLREGVDFGLLDADGRIASIAAFLGNEPPKDGEITR